VSPDNPADSQQLEALAQRRFQDLTDAEKALVSVAPQGQLAVCGASDDPSHPSNDPQNADRWGPERRIRADLLTWLCQNRQASSFVHPKGLQILGATIVDALDLSFTTIGFPLALARCRMLGELNLQGARTRTISLQGSRVHSILADGAIIDGALLIRDEFHSETRVLLTGAKIDGPLDCTGSTFDTIDLGPALVADAIVVSGPVFLRRGFRANGEVRFPHARIAADLDCSQGTFAASLGANQFNTALTAEGAVVGGSVFLKNGFTATGLVLLHGIQIEFNLDCVAGRVVNPSQQGVEGTGTALNFDASVVKSSVMLQDGFQAEGVVSLIGTQIGGNLACRDADLGTGLVAERCVVKGILFWRGIHSAATVNLDLIGASVDSISDDAASWPSRGNLQLHGFLYLRFSASSPRGVKERLDWLARLKSFTPQPYLQLAAVLKDEDDDAGARKVQYQMACLRNQENRGKLARIWNFILKVGVGYGYYPGRALSCLLCLTAIGFVLYYVGYSAGSMVPTEKDAYQSFKTGHRLPNYYEPFHASIFSLENSFPLVKLGQVDHWRPDPNPESSAHLPLRSLGCSISTAGAARFLRAFGWAQILLGWLFATMGIAAVTGLVRKD
jgi:hypothetical protein